MKFRKMISTGLRTVLQRSRNMLTIRALASQPDPFVMETLSGPDEAVQEFQLKESISSVKFNKNARVVILKSDVEGAFCTGADLKERKSMPVEDVPKFVDSLRSSFSELEFLPQPVIAAIDGYALGGGLEMALACDIRVASTSAKIGLTETRLAIIPGAGGTQRLTRAVGPSMAKELIFTGRMISGEEACRIGLVNHCTQDDAFSKAMEIAREIVPRGPLAVRLAKIAIDAGSGMDLNSGLVVEQQCYAQWDVMVSVALSRPQVTAAPMSEVERRFHSLQLEEERERSLLCDFELKSRHDENLKLKNPRSREVSDERSLQRMLDRKLLLIVQQRFGQENYESPWILPQLKHEPGETLRETAERCIRQTADGVKALLYGNAPFAVFSQKYPKPLSKRLDTEGAKIFFLNAVLDPTTSFSANKKEVVDYKWVVREEFWSTVPGTKYKSCVNSIFLE
ncbi:MRP-L46 domain-containing protein [Trichostrongylus colubriformis]|uniref:MRP-L46 domain-containing protein n=1 Tax=Trichostrongylus colubriformis TaxID=6319 RepID=A0AAN8FFD3_TRICO